MTDSGAYLPNFIFCNECKTLDILKSAPHVENGSNGISSHPAKEDDDTDSWDDVDQDDVAEANGDDLETTSYNRKAFGNLLKKRVPTQSLIDMCSSCNHLVSTHTTTFRIIRNQYQESKMRCNLCGTGSSSQSVMPYDVRKVNVVAQDDL